MLEKEGRNEREKEEATPFSVEENLLLQKAEESLADSRSLRNEDWYEDPDLRSLGAYFEIQFQYLKALKEVLFDYKTMHPELCSGLDTELSSGERTEILDEIAHALAADGLDTKIVDSLEKFSEDEKFRYPKENVELARFYMEAVRRRETENPTILSSPADVSEAALQDIKTWHWRGKTENLD